MPFEAIRSLFAAGVRNSERPSRVIRTGPLDSKLRNHTSFQCAVSLPRFRDVLFRAGQSLDEDRPTPRTTIPELAFISIFLSPGMIGGRVLGAFPCRQPGSANPLALRGPTGCPI